MSISMQYTYDASGNIASIKDPKGRVTRLTYWPDWYGSLRQITDPQGRITKFEVDAYGRRTKITGPTGKVTEVSYDASDRPIALRKDGKLVADRVPVRHVIELDQFRH